MLVLNDLNNILWRRSHKNSPVTNTYITRKQKNYLKMFLGIKILYQVTEHSRILKIDTIIEEYTNLCLEN